MKKSIFFLMLFLVSIFGVSFAESAGVDTGKQVTGIVIDTRGLGLQKAMCPTIYDKNGQVVNNIIHTDLNWISSKGAVEYYEAETVKDVFNGKSRAGKNYIMIKAIELKDFNVNPVISLADADTLRSLPEFNDILKKANIVLIK
ncbi:MAG: hypothetical protein LLG02_15175 [Pelosinus sp.]|nr:hypothetical protein [Pelosinus sp.]